jgi:anaerobic sulfite reductase subunit B
MATETLTDRIVPAGSMEPRPFRVAARRRETADTWTLRLEPAGGPPIAAAPGQFTMLYAFGIGEVPISVSGDRRGPLVHTVRAVGAVTRAVCATRPGTVLGVRGPFGNAWPVEDAAGGDLVLVAGGIGLAPLRPALLHALRHRREYGRVIVLYGSRMPEELLYRRQLERWARRADLDVDVTVDAGSPAWTGKVGVVPKLIASARFHPATTTALVCGPEIMMRFAARGLRERGVDDERIFVSMERNMRCGLGHCGHCQLGPTLICRDGPVYRLDQMEALIAVREL